MALRGKTLSNMMSGANVTESADASESVSFIGDKGKRRKKKKVMMGTGQMKRKTNFGKCYNPNH